MVTPELAADLLRRSREGETERALAAEVGCAPSYMHTILKRAEAAEAQADSPVPVGWQRTAREALEAIINDTSARHADIVAAARALGALKGEAAGDETSGRPSSVTLSGPVVCPACGYDLRAERMAEVDAMLAQFEAPEDQPATSSRPGSDSAPE
jgi:hypothetical protein